MDYTIITDNSGKRLCIEYQDGEKKVFIPLDPNNRLFQKIKEKIDLKTLPVRNIDEMTRAQKIAFLKNTIRKWLRKTDWALTVDSTLTNQQKTAVTNYRATLRNLPNVITTAQIDACMTNKELKTLIPKPTFDIDEAL